MSLNSIIVNNNNVTTINDFQNPGHTFNGILSTDGVYNVLGKSFYDEKNHEEIPLDEIKYGYITQPGNGFAPSPSATPERYQVNVYDVHNITSVLIHFKDECYNLGSPSYCFWRKTGTPIHPYNNYYTSRGGLYYDGGEHTANWTLVMIPQDAYYLLVQSVWEFIGSPNGIVLYKSLLEQYKNTINIPTLPEEHINALQTTLNNYDNVTDFLGTNNYYTPINKPLFASGAVIYSSNNGHVKITVNEEYSSSDPEHGGAYPGQEIIEEIGIFLVITGKNIVNFDKEYILDGNKYISFQCIDSNMIKYKGGTGFGILGGMGQNFEINAYAFSTNTPKIDKIHDIIVQNSKLPAKSLRWYAMGDSFTEIDSVPESTGYRVQKGYMSRVCDKIPQLTFVNAGHSGTTMLNVNSVPSGYDIYSVCFGTNDFSRYPLGTYNDYLNRNEGTIYGNFGRLIYLVRNAAGNAPYFAITTTHWGCGSHVYNNQPIGNDSYTANKFGYYLEDLENAVIECCEKDNIPYVDVFHNSHITPKNALSFARVQVNSQWRDIRYPEIKQYCGQQFDPHPYPKQSVWTTYDGQHPSDIGFEIYAELIAPKIVELLFC